MAGERSFISTPGRLQIALAASYITISDRWRRELSRNFFIQIFARPGDRFETRSGLDEV